jgi:hypothetical protein
MPVHLWCLASLSTLLLLVATLGLWVPAVSAVEPFSYRGYVSVVPEMGTTMTLNFNGNKVTGTLEARSIIGENVRLPGTSIKFTGTLSGSWEGSGSITGTYRGTGGPEQNERAGTFTVSKSGLATVLFHSTGLYYNDYIFTPIGKVYTPTEGDSGTTGTAGQGEGVIVMENQSGMNAHLCVEPEQFGDPNRVAPGGSRQYLAPPGGAKVFAVRGGSQIDSLSVTVPEGGSIRVVLNGSNKLVLMQDKESGTKNTTKKKKTTKKDEIDPDEIESITLVPGSFKMSPGERSPFPQVFGVMKTSRESVELKDMEISWTGGKSINIETDEGGGFTVSKNAPVGDRLTLTARLRVGMRELNARAPIQVVEPGDDKKERGAITVSARIAYSLRPADPDLAEKWTATPVPDDWPKKPLSADVTLTGPDGVVGKITLTGDCTHRFENLKKGQYRAGLSNIRLPQLPGGYVENPDSPFRNSWTTLPNGDKWEANLSLDCSVHLPKDYRGYVHGLVTYKGTPVPDAKVTFAGMTWGEVKEVMTDSKGNYRINTDKMRGDTYKFMVVKMNNVRDGKLWASPEDLLDIAGTRDQEPHKVEVPLFNPNGVEIPIECLTRKEIFKDNGDWMNDIPSVPK